MSDATNDLGLRTLRSIYDQLMIDAEWSKKAKRSFAWTAAALPQVVSVSPMIEHRGYSVSRVNAYTLMVVDITLPSTTVETLLAITNKTAVGSAYVHFPEERTVALCLAESIHEEIAESRWPILGALTILQLCEAELKASALAELLKGKVADGAMYGLAMRDVPDNMLSVPDSVFIPKGQARSAFAVEADCAQVRELCVDTPYCSLGESPAGMCIEVPFGADETTLIELRADMPHPWLGAGLAVRTTFPLVSEEEAAALAANASRAQLASIDSGSGAGAWFTREVRGSSCLAWTRFLPNALARPGAILDVALNEINRAISLDELYNGVRSSGDARAVLASRMVYQRRN